ncbi:MAG: DUF4365 domain-containing protein [Nitrospinales bacterium]
MEKNSFPKITNSSLIGNMGVNAISKIVSDDLKWLFRKNHQEDDFGIDAYIDIVTENNSVTGQCFAAQIKTGQSYFRSETPNGYTYYGEAKHLNYYMNNPLPIIILLYDEIKNICYWSIFDSEKTEGTQNGWKLNIPKTKVFGKESKKALLSILGPAEDHSDNLKAHWAFNDQLKKAGLILYPIDREDIESGNVEQIQEFFNRLQINDSLARKLQGRVEISISGYYYDKRELFEIKEVVDWVRRAHETDINWFFFLISSPISDGLKLLYACFCGGEKTHTKIIVPSKIRVEMDTSLLKTWFDNNFIKLNQLTEHLGMTIEENKVISFAIFEALDMPYDASSEE